ncbi:unnamed protein product [Effrenium voratum]|uniref:Uncharacterized protein n=1 Tax=Effrenium voratum TaxID=2562239 RepID=A0AA36NFE1_9DINO|nr:unnamed protein product [Effrenium voratum]CAJ1401256.1 unnamed protein product [Effrenium voratum]CAJ1458694.1 unnamed protein product [Effrenium voratum]|mmetsp:Transcript_68828/g.163978  ORF Transcript_68828/g.163978 Transcript_68828/m.163978 type:complete len:246 (+) Transcript_68828:96-833(+)
MAQMGTLTGGDYENINVMESVMTLGGLLARSESMEITNDPRFFQDSVLSLRLAAFGGLGVVAGLMVQNSMDHLFDMKKTMRFGPDHIDTAVQLTAFIILSLVHFLNIIATYVGVAQPYHVIRLMTAGPVGFESAACYYLNKNIIAWRHFAVFGALASMPLFLASSGLRMIVKFDRENVAEPDPPQNLNDIDRIVGISVCVGFILMAVVLTYIHFKHWGIFEERYKLLKPNLHQHHDVLDTMSRRK